MREITGSGNGQPVHVTYLRYWREWLRPHAGRMVVIVVLMVIVGVAGAGYAKFMQLVISGLETSDPDVVFWGPAGIISLTVVKGLGDYARKAMVNRVMSTVQARMQSTLYRSLLYMDLSSLLAESPAALSVRFTADLEVVRSAASEVFGILSSILIIATTIVVMLTIDWVMTIALIVIFVLAFAPVGVIGTHVRGIAASTQREIARMTSSVHEGLSGIRMIRTYRLERRLQDSADDAFARLHRLRVSLENWRLSVSPLIEILGGLAVAALLFLVSLRIGAGALDLAGFVGLLTGIGVITNPAQRLGLAYAVAKQGEAALDRVFGVFDAQNQIKDGDFEFAAGEKANGRIRFRSVDFVYPDGYSALSDIDLDIEAGQTVAVVGRSGAGKSTLFNLIPRLFDVSGGAIEIDGRDIREFTLATLRDQISVVSQESVLLSGTVLDNIAFGNADQSDDDCVRAAKAAGAHEFIKELPDGYKTWIEPSQQAFSGGEKQRLSIARAILRDAPILLLDEPTSALDAHSESVIRQAMAELSRSRTTLVIAHRLSTILDSDLIVVMDRGRLAETGTHDELLDNSDIYGDLFNLQFDGVSTTADRRTAEIPPSVPVKEQRSLLARLARMFGL
ncbi:MAG: ABC transporter ATP-binding protein [Paracoccaceae bacterium]|nr:ABC transporter ATP-binding protein [Paracoccaceae bacterium]MDE2913061.1 ABC transporter ATP-binding protein [Paracoccaceae bacterium]